MPIPVPTPPPINPIEIINAVSAFYEIAWSRLLWFVGVGGAVIIIIIPIFAQYVQRRMFRARELKIKTELTEQIHKELGKRFSESLAIESMKIDAKITELQKSIDSEVSRALAGVFFVQARLCVDKKEYPPAVDSFCRSAEHSLTANDHQNLQKALNYLSGIIPHLNVKDLELPLLRETIESLFEKLGKANKFGIHTNYIETLKHEYAKVQKKPAAQ